MKCWGFGKRVKRMNKNELIDRVSDYTGMKKKDASLATMAVFACIAEALAKEEKITISGFGVMEVRHRAARKGHLPTGKQEFDIPAMKIPVFRPSKQLKEKINI